MNIEPLFLRRPQLSLSFAKKTALKSRHKDLFQSRVNIHNTRSGSEEYVEHNCGTKRFFLSPLPFLTRELNKSVRNGKKTN